MCFYKILIIMLEIEYMVILVVFGLIVLAPYVLWCLRLWFFKKHKLDWYLVNGRWVTWGVLGFIVSVPIVFFSVVALCFSSNYHTRNLVNEDHLYEKVIEEQNDTVRLVKVDELGNYEVIADVKGSFAVVGDLLSLYRSGQSAYVCFSYGALDQCFDRGYRGGAGKWFDGFGLCQFV